MVSQFFKIQPIPYTELLTFASSIFDSNIKPPPGIIRILNNKGRNKLMKFKRIIPGEGTYTTFPKWERYYE